MGLPRRALRSVGGSAKPLVRGSLMATPLTVCTTVTNTGRAAFAAAARQHCRVGAHVELRDAGDSGDEGTIAVWLRCPSVFGWRVHWKQIGHLRADPGDGWASKLERGSLKVERAYVSGCDVDAQHAAAPRISLRIEFLHD
ncbi:MAG: hypothetical protein KJ832_16060 [Gammaproteobacteria bacterium]|nr:hypothetical protein [Gammaproteobacteria bacterium]